MRIGECLDDEHFQGKQYYHVDCYKLKPRFKNIDLDTQLYNVAELQKKDRTRVLKVLKDELKRINKISEKKTSKEKSKKSPSKPKSKSKSKKEEEKKEVS